MKRLQRCLHRASNPGLALAAMAVLGACAGLGKTPEETVMQRAEERLAYFVAEDYTAAYEYLSPGYRSGFSLNDYQRQQLLRKVKWMGARVEGSNCSTNSCKVQISVDYRVFGALPGVNRMDSTRTVEEDWVLVDRKWYLLPNF